MTITSPHDLCNALFRYHRYKMSLPPSVITAGRISPRKRKNMSNTEMVLLQGLLETKEIIDAAEAQEITEKFYILENQQFLYESDRQKIPMLDETFTSFLPSEVNSIHVASFLGDTEIVETLLKKLPKGTKPSWRSMQNYGPLRYAFAGQSVDTLKLLIKTYPEDVAFSSSPECSAIHAAQLGNLEIIQMLYHVNPKGFSEKDIFWGTALHYAAANTEPCLPFVMYLVGKYPEGVKVLGDDDQLPLHIALQRGNLETAKYLFEVYPDGAKVQDSYGNLPIWYATERNNIELVKSLSEFYLEGVRIKGQLDSLPMHRSAQEELPTLMKLFLELHPKGLLERNSGYMMLPIDIAWSFGRLDTVKIIIEHVFSSNNDLAHQFALELFNPRYPSWTGIIDKFGHDVLLEMDALRSFPLLPYAIVGKINIDEIKFLINDLQHMNLADMVDSHGQSVMTVVIKEASKNQRDCHVNWNTYYKPLLELINSRIHNIKAPEDNLLSSRGKNRSHDIFHCAIVNGLPWYGGLKEICMANIEKLASTDEESGLYPFMLSSEVSSSSTFEMLRMSPDVIQMITNESRCDTDDHQ